MQITFDTKASQTELLLVRAILEKYIHPTMKQESVSLSSDSFTATHTGVTVPVYNDYEIDLDDDDTGALPITANNDEISASQVPPPAAVIAQVVPAPPVVSAAPPPATVSPPPAPNTQEPAAVSTGADAELDSDGVAWDPTIHSETRMKNANGTWRKRRTTKNVEVKQSIPGLEHLTPNSVPAPPSRKMVNTFVRINGAQELIKAPDGATDEELSTITGQPTMREDRYHATEQPQVTGYQPSAAPGSPIPPPPSGGSSVMPPPPPAAPPAPAVVKTAPQGAPAGTFAELMERVTKYFGSQSITTQDLIEVCATFSIKSVQECYAQPALIPLVSNAIDEKVKVRAAANGGV